MNVILVHRVVRIHCVLFGILIYKFDNSDDNEEEIENNIREPEDDIDDNDKEEKENDNRNDNIIKQNKIVHTQNH